MASFLSGIVTYLPSVREIPVTMSSMIAIGSSSLGLSDVIMLSSASFPLTSPISKRRRLERLPPQPNRQTSLWGSYSRSVDRRLSSAIALCA